MQVVKVVERVMDELVNQGIVQPDDIESNTGDRQLDIRDHHVEELLTSERKYIQDLETLQDYMHCLQSENVVSNDVIHGLFLNLNTILDFQRKFLIKMEAMYDQEPEEQRFGSLLVAYVRHSDPKPMFSDKFN